MEGASAPLPVSLATLPLLLPTYTRENAPRQQLCSFSRCHPAAVPLRQQ
eukprot:COSAG01_NODE_2700_length_7232_cov_3.028876_7_plen_49_part_00